MHEFLKPSLRKILLAAILFVLALPINFLYIPGVTDQGLGFALLIWPIIILPLAFGFLNFPIFFYDFFPLIVVIGLVQWYLLTSLLMWIVRRRKYWGYLVVILAVIAVFPLALIIPTPEDTNPIIVIEDAVFSADEDSATISVRNAGSVSVELVFASVQGINDNIGFTSQLRSQNLSIVLKKGDVSTVTFTDLDELVSGDVVVFLVRTTGGHFGQSVYEVP